MVEHEQHERAPEPGASPPDVAARIASRIADGVARCGGELLRLDRRALEAAFPRHVAEVRAQLAALEDGEDGSAGGAARQRLDRIPHQLGPYRVRSVLGRGAAGVVVSAFDTRLHRDVALKLLTMPWAHEREGRAMAALSEHPNVTRVHGIEEHEGLALVVMELVKGTSLDRVLARIRQRATAHPESDEIMLRSLVEAGGEAVPGSGEETAPDHAARRLGGSYFRDVARAIAGAARGLAHAHRAGIVHRDVKPANLILTPEGSVKITDFSHAKGEALQRLSRTGQFIGTVAYASPEQVSGRRSVGPPSDIWSLGATLYELVTLQLPFPGSDEDAVLKSILDERPAPPRVLAPRLPAEMELIILRCLEKEPRYRYADSALLAEHLERFAAGEYVDIRPVRPISRLWRAMRRPTRRSVAALLGLVVVAVVAGFGTARVVSAIQDGVVRRGVAASFADTAREHLRKGLEDRRPSDLQRAVTAAIMGLASTPEDEEARRTVLVTAGRRAYAEADLAAACRLLAAAHARRALDDSTLLELARAAFGAGRLEEARRYYASLEHRGLRSSVRLDLGLLAAWEAGRSVHMQLRRVLRASALEGLPATAVLSLAKSSSHGHVLRLHPGGLLAPVRHAVCWLPPHGELPVGGDGPSELVLDALVADVDGDGTAELLAQGEEHLWLAEGPFSVADSPSWERLRDPTRIEGNLTARSGHLVLLRTRHVAVSRYRKVGRMWLDHGGAPESTIDLDGGDVFVLRSFSWEGAPALLVSQGAWHQWRVSLIGIGPRDELLPIASAQLGVATDARMFRDSESGERFVLAVTGRSEIYLSDMTFGRGAPYGWAHGLYVLRVDEQTRRLEPVAALRLPRPRNGNHTVMVQDLDGDGRVEILVGQKFSGTLPSTPAPRTLVLRWRGLDAGPLVPVLWLPGCVRSRASAEQRDVLAFEVDHDRTALVELR